MRNALAEASWHVAHRSAFGGVLADKPLMQNVIANLAVESEAATDATIRLAAAVDNRARPARGRAATDRPALSKFWVCKRTPMMVAEALECLGGNGYVEESGMPLLFRESPLNSIWEGSGDVNALDVLRALGQEPEVLEAWLTEVGLAAGRGPAARPGHRGRPGDAGDTTTLEVSARRLAGQMAACLQASLLVRFAPPAIADAFCATRLGGDYNGTLGALPGRHRPALHRRPNNARRRLSRRVDGATCRQPFSEVSSRPGAGPQHQARRRSPEPRPAPGAGGRPLKDSA